MIQSDHSLMIDNINRSRIGNILIKHSDKWRGFFYLTNDLTFTVDRSLAARFYILKSGDTTILNGDRVTINSGDKSISVDESNTIRLLDGTIVHNQGINSFIIMNESKYTDPITYETAIYLISDRDNETALKYEWGMDLLSPTDSNSSVINYKPTDYPRIVNSKYNLTTEISNFEFFLEKADGPITNLDHSRQLALNPPKLFKLFEDNKEVIIIILLMVALIFCIIITKDTYL